MTENCNQNKIKYLNLGCGGHFSKDPEWLNMDIAPQDSRYVHQYQLQLGIPFSDCSFEGVYHSHILEHFPRGQVMPFLRECYRVLKPGGTIRIAVPDLEQILRAYLAALDAVRQAGEKGDPAAEDRLIWMQVELLDQLVRSRSGGMMGPAWSSANDDLISFIRQRTGGELENIPRQPVQGPLRLPEQDLAIEAPDLNFLASGEKHCWMYDPASLCILLRQAGFTQVREAGCKTDRFSGFQPDALADGSARKPDSCYVEAIRPDTSKTESPRIAIFSTTDRGGAGIAAMRLQAGLRQTGANSIAYLQCKTTTQPNIYVLPPVGHERVVPMGQGAALSASGSNLLARALSKYPDRPRECEMFSISEANTRLENIPNLAEADIINLHWVATFLDIPADTRFLKGKKIVWTLHDMNPFTGGCHYADGCEGFLQKCGNCPQLGSKKESDLSRQNWKRREYSYRNLDITVVTPSRWLADEAKRSSLFGRFPVHVIPYGLQLDIYKPYPKTEVRKAVGIAEDAKVLLFTADNVLNKRKGLAYLLKALETLHTRPEASNIVLMLLGNGGENISGLGYQVKALGNLDSPVAMAAAYSAADAVVLPMIEDSGNTILEAMACGTPTVTYCLGDAPQLLDHLQTGYLARPNDATDLAEGMRWALTEQPGRSRLCRGKALESHQLDKHVQSYLELFAQLLNSK